MKLRNKSDERLQAEAEVYALGLEYGRLDDFDDWANLLKNGWLWGKMRAVLGGNVFNVVEEHYSQYVSFLREGDRGDVVEREENLKLYNDKFKGEVRALRSRFQGQLLHREMDEFVGEGFNGTVFSLEIGDGEKYAVKFSEVAKIGMEVKALLESKGVLNSSELVTYSFQEEALVMKFLEGKNLEELFLEGEFDFKREHIVELVKTMIALDEREIELDPVLGNILYDNDKGFSVIDFMSRSSYSRGIGGPVLERILPSLRLITGYYFECAVYYEELADESDIPVGLQIRILNNCLELIDILEKEFPVVFSDYSERGILNLMISNRFFSDSIPEIRRLMNEIRSKGF